VPGKVTSETPTFFASYSTMHYLKTLDGYGVRFELIPDVEVFLALEREELGAKLLFRF